MHFKLSALVAELISMCELAHCCLLLLLHCWEVKHSCMFGLISRADSVN